MRLLRHALVIPSALLALSAGTIEAQRGDIPTVAASAGQFTTLVAAVQAAGLLETLKGAGPFTVFAPTDEAFRKLPAGTVENLLKPENREQLRAILLYHVVAGRVPASTARTLSNAKTVEGRELRIRSEGSALRINNATVIRADVQATNGVIHVIDEVLLPPADGMRGGSGESSSTSSRAARELLSLAVRRGAPLFNDDQPEATAAIYEVAMKGVLTLGGNVPSAVRRSFERALRDAEHESDAADRAWMLRRAIDDADAALEGRMRTTARHY